MRSEASSASSSVAGRKVTPTADDCREFSKADDPGDHAFVVDLEDPDRGLLVAAQMPGELKPAPFEPPGVLREAAPRGHRVPLMHTTRIEKQCAVDLPRVRAVRVPEDDDVRVWKPSPQAAGQAGVGPKIAQAQRPQQREGFLDPPRTVAVDQHEALARDGQLARERKLAKRAVMVAAHSLDRRDARQ